MTEHARPPFVLAFAADMQGCGYHRIAVPMVSMIVAGVAEGRIDVNQWPLEMIQAVHPDVVIFQRYVEDSQIETIKMVREALPDALLVYELDDYLGEIPAASFHASFMPPNLSEKVARAAALCDKVTTSTEPLAAWFRELGMKDVVVVGNAIPGAAIRARPARISGRLRIGFAGGISHDGDLELIRPAMAAIGEEVEWVFFGTQPRNPPVRVEYHNGVPPHEYQAVMLGLDLDLVLAPLETNRFNECKSNLRLIEAGMIGAAAIVQNIEPYRAGSPPVAGYASTADEWTAAIRRFIDASAETRGKFASELQEWTARHHTIEARLPKRISAWLARDGEPVWRPKATIERTEDTVLSLPQDYDPPEAFGAVTRCFSLEDACARAAKTGSDVLWMRPGAMLDELSWTSMRQTLVMADSVAAVVPLGSDGPNPFPHRDRWTPLSADIVSAMSKVVRRALVGRKLTVPALSGPCILLSARALAMLGTPDVTGCGGHEEQAAFEWSLRATMKGWTNLQAADAFSASMVPPTPAAPIIMQRIQLRGYAEAFKHLNESLSDQERADLEMDLLRLQWTGPQPGTMGFGSDYVSWSALRGDLPGVAVDQGVDLEKDLMVAYFGDADEAMFDSGWVVLIDERLEWHTNGLATLAQAVRDAPPGVSVIYSDHDFRDENGGLYPDFKPDFDETLFLARDYITPVCAVRKSIAWGINTRAELYAELLEVARINGASAFRHIPKMLAVLRDDTPEEKAMAAIERRMAIESAYGGSVEITAIQPLPGTLSVIRRWQEAFSDVPPLVSIIVPTLGAGRLIQPCVNTIRQHTTYPNFEVIVVQNGDREEPELGVALGDPRVRVVHWKASDGVFSWSALNNEAVQKHARGEFLCFMNDDVCVGATGWLDNMMGQAAVPDVGAVGARLVHPAGYVQHVGVICHKGIAGHLHKGLPNGNPGNGWLAATSHEAQAVTAACMLVSRDHFDLVDGFDEVNFPMNYSDTDFCMKLRKAHLRNVVEMSAEMLHPEGTSRTDPNDQVRQMQRLQRDNTLFAERWPDPDPYWNPNLTIGLAQGGMAIPGLNRDLLTWEDPPVNRAGTSIERVLLINDLPGAMGQALQRTRAGEICFAADVSGLTLKLTAPIPANVGAWDIRHPGVLNGHLNRLGITKVVLRSLIGSTGAAAPVETIRALQQLDAAVEVDPIADEVMTPWRNPNWKQGDAPFGFVDILSWQAALEPFLGNAAYAQEAAD